MVASVGDPHDRTGRPEIDDLLDAADAELQAAQAAGDPARIAAACAAYDAAYAEFGRVGRELIAEAQRLMEARLDRNAMFLDQMGASWKAGDAAMDALTGRRRSQPPAGSGEPDGQDR